MKYWGYDLVQSVVAEEFDKQHKQFAKVRKNTKMGVNRFSHIQEHIIGSQCDECVL